MAAPKKPARRWTMTLKKRDDLPDYDPLPNDETREEYLSVIRYAIFGDEIGAAGGYPHWQGYIEFREPIRMAAIKKLFCRDDAHLEIARTRTEARDYCKKEGKWREVGEWSEGGQGARMDLAAAAADAKAGMGLMDLYENHMSVMFRYGRAMKEYTMLHEKKRIRERGFRKRIVVLIVGPPGIGKTRLATDLAGPEHYTLPKSNGGAIWWDGYDGEPTVIINEVDKMWFPPGYLLELLDGYPMMINAKGSMCMLKAANIVLTANKPIEEWAACRGCDDTVAGIRRRIDDTIATEAQTEGAATGTPVTALRGDLVILEPGAPDEATDSQVTLGMDDWPDAEPPSDEELSILEKL